MIHSARRAYTSFDERYPSHTKLFRFLISGGTSAAVDLGVLFVLTTLLGIWYLASTVLAFLVAFGVSFFLQKFWTFRDHSRTGMHAQAGRYFLITALNLGLNTILVYALVEYGGFYYLVAQIAASVAIACESYFVYQKFIFRTRMP